MQKKLISIFFTISLISTSAYSDQPPIVINSEIIQEINDFNNMTGLVSPEDIGVSGGTGSPSGGGSCGDLADCDGGVSLVNSSHAIDPSLEADLISEALSLLGPNSDEDPGLGPGVPPSIGPSCDCAPSIGIVLPPTYMNIEDMSLVDLAAKELGLIQSR